MENLKINYESGMACQIDTSNLISYSDKYWEKYQTYKKSPIADKLNQTRIDLVNKYKDKGNLIDIGIGNGHFCETINCKGYDINPIAIQWLKERNLYLDPYLQENDSLSLWDTLEHIIDPSLILKTINKYCFLSLPIVSNWDKIKEWKHFRENEHLFYWDYNGLINYMNKQGFEFLESNRLETLAGREDITTFVFLKKINTNK